MKLALITNFIAPYRLPLYLILNSKVDRFKIFISVPMEPNRNWKIEWGNLDVTLQKNISIPRTWRHPAGFSETLYTQFPYSTFFDLLFYRPQVVISSEMGFRTVMAILYKWLIRSKLILWATLSEYSELNRGKIRDKLRRWILKNVDAVIVNGKSGARYISSFHIIDPNHLFYAPYTTNMESFLQIPSSRKDTDGMNLLYAGQFVQRKGIFHFIEILAEYLQNYPEAKVNLILVGDGPERQKIENFGCPTNLKISIQSFVQYKDLPTFFENAHAYIFPTLADEWGLVVNEAFASALPVIGSVYSQAVEELVEDNITGLLFKPDDEKEIREAVKFILTTPIDQLRLMGINAREKIKTYTPQFAAEQFSDAIRYVMGK